MPRLLRVTACWGAARKNAGRDAGAAEPTSRYRLGTKFLLAVSK
jgi:hypothetical protein